GLAATVAASVSIAGAPPGIGPATATARAGPIRTGPEPFLPVGGRGSRRDRGVGGGAEAGRGEGVEDGVEHPDGPGLGQRLVAVAALRRVHARWAPPLARARPDRVAGGAQPVRRDVVRALREACAARAPVRHEDR